MPDAAPPPLRRFYREVSVAPDGGRFAVLLDGKPVRTPARRPLLLPTERLADAVAGEWRAQSETVVPGTMPLTRLANSTIDGVSERADEVAADIARYAGSDLVLYRAGEPDRLVAAQADAWDPVLRSARERHGARFVLSQGVMFVRQPPEALERIEEAVRATGSPFGLAALHTITSLTGSVLLALAVRDGDLDPEAAWRAAHVDELFQESVWGEDREAGERRAARRAEFLAAERLLRLSAG